MMGRQVWQMTQPLIYVYVDRLHTILESLEWTRVLGTEPKQGETPKHLVEEKPGIRD